MHLSNVSVRTTLGNECTTRKKEVVTAGKECGAGGRSGAEDPVQSCVGEDFGVLRERGGERQC